jgi:hypothetical protein
VGSSPIVVVLFDFLSHFFKFILFILSCNQIFFCPTAVTYSGIQKYNTRLYIRQQYLAMSFFYFLSHFFRSYYLFCPAITYSFVLPQLHIQVSKNIIHAFLFVINTWLCRIRNFGCRIGVILFVFHCHPFF